MIEIIKKKDSKFYIKGIDIAKVLLNNKDFNKAFSNYQILLNQSDIIESIFIIQKNIIEIEKTNIDIQTTLIKHTKLLDNLTSQLKFYRKENKNIVTCFTIISICISILCILAIII